ncbi:MAG: hypothetical protein WAN47_00790 [Nitrosotalea sp.]
MKKIQKDMTLDEVEKDIFRRIQRGESYSEIVKTRYRIDGRIKKFNISGISKIKQKFTSQASDSENKDPNAALLFKLFEEGESLCDIVVKTQLSPEYVKEMYDKFCEMKKMTVLPAGFIKVLFEMAGWMKDGKITGIHELQRYLETAVCHFLELVSGDLCDFCENPETWK